MVSMKITAKQLRIQPGRVISQVHSWQEITITYRGKPRARIIPIIEKKTGDNMDGADDELFGIWKGRKDMKNVDAYIRNMRKGRAL
jgi:prevent-host-death family protein